MVKSVVEKEIEKKILKGWTEKHFGINSFDRSDVIYYLEQAISLTLAECQKQNSDFVKKLKYIIQNYGMTLNNNLDEHIKGNIFEFIDELAKEFGIGEGKNGD